MIRIDSTQLISGKTIVSLYAGHGIQAQNIPSTGTNGAGYLYNDIAAQGAASTDEMRGEILTYPSSGTFSVNEDSSFSFTGASAGTYTATYRGFKNGVSYGDYTITLTIGSTPFSGNIQKQALIVSSKTLTVTTGTSIPFTGLIQKSSLTLTPKTLTVVAGQNLGFIGNIAKLSLSLQGKQLQLLAEQTIPFNGEILPRSYTLNGKTLVMADTEYPTLSTSRLFFFKTVNKNNYII